MNIYKLNDSNPLPLAETAVTVGMFDGVHLGHRHILRTLADTANRHGLQPVVVTFDRHPRQVLATDVSTHFRLTTHDERYALLAECGVRQIVELPFTPQLANLSACQFLRQVLVGQLHARALVLGYDNQFGSRRHDDFAQLPALAQKLGVSLLTAEAVTLDGLKVSSTRIRQILRQGQVQLAAQMLGRPYRLWGNVERGRQMGRQLGYPTANVSLADPTKTLPAPGVYAVSVTLHDGTSGLYGMANLGAQPTFGLEKTVFEVNIFDFDGNLYDTTLTVDFVERLRDVCRFDSIAQLTAQLATDRKQALQKLENLNVNLDLNRNPNIDAPAS